MLSPLDLCNTPTNTLSFFFKFMQRDVSSFLFLLSLGPFCLSICTFSSFLGGGGYFQILSQTRYSLINKFSVLMRFWMQAFYKFPLSLEEKKDSAGSDDTASMIKGGGYIGARTRQPPTTQTIKKKLMWVTGVVCRSTQTQTLTVVACVVLQCIIPCFYECRCMSDGVFVQFVCQFLILSRLRSARGLSV